MNSTLPPRGPIDHQPAKSEPVEFTVADFIPLPAKSLDHRGVKFTRSTLIRGIHAGVIKSKLLRMPGRTKGRRYLLRESLDAFLESCLVDVPMPSAA